MSRVCILRFSRIRWLPSQEDVSLGLVVEGFDQSDIYIFYNVCMYVCVYIYILRESYDIMDLNMPLVVRGILRNR